jgi:hypothetical protein
MYQEKSGNPDIDCFDKNPGNGRKKRQPSLNLLLFLSGFSLCPSLCLDVGALGFFVEVKNAERQNVEIQIGKLQNVDITNFLYLGHLT